MTRLEGVSGWWRKRGRGLGAIFLMVGTTVVVSKRGGSFLRCRVRRPRSRMGHGSRDHGDSQKILQDRQKPLPDEAVLRKFEEYYRTQGIVPGGDKDWQMFMGNLTLGLARGIRITESGPFRQILRSLIYNRTHPSPPLDSISKTSTQTNFESPKNSSGTDWRFLETIPWYPRGLAWQLPTASGGPGGLGRRGVVKEQRRQWEGYHKFLNIHSAAGHITQQEAASLVPPLVLDPKPNDLILDLCASPGSKSSLILDRLCIKLQDQISQRSQDSPEVSIGPMDMKSRWKDMEIRKSARKLQACPVDSRGPCEEEGGVLVANEISTGRAKVLVHQLHRIKGAGSRLAVTMQDARFFPNYFKFDKILCDVPCSCDGTIGKNPEILRKWRPWEGVSMHTLQLHIAKRAVHLLREGGVMVYSTCSLDPLENEAVITAVLRSSNGSVRVKDISSILPEGLRWREGLSTWYLPLRNGTLLSPSSYPLPPDPRILGDSQRHSETPENSQGKVNIRQDSEGSSEILGNSQRSPEIPGDSLRHLRYSMVPPRGGEVEKFRLERCVRLMPHLSGTSGFFIAALEKISRPSQQGIPDKEDIESLWESPRDRVVENPGIPAVDTFGRLPIAKNRTRQRKLNSQLFAPLNQRGLQLIAKEWAGLGALLNQSSIPVFWSTYPNVSSLTHPTYVPRKVYFLSKSLAKLVHQDLLPNPLSVGNIVFQLTTYKRPKSDEKLTLSGSEGNPETENGGGEKWSPQSIYRLTDHGAALLGCSLRNKGHRTLNISNSGLRVLLTDMNEEFTPTSQLPIQDQTRVLTLPLGPGFMSASIEGLPVSMPIWRSPKGLSVYVSKDMLQSTLDILKASTFP
ncbi:hypothetical protein AAMO2058_001712100 [Amorphochlora amoebiformis]